MSSPEWTAMAKLVAQIYAKADAGKTMVELNHFI